MIKGDVSSSENGKGLDLIKDELLKLMKTDILIGIPEDDKSREDKNGNEEEITNAQLLYMHTNGSALNHIPSRPVLQPAIEAHEQELSEQLKEAAILILDGKIYKAEQLMEQIGMYGQNIAREWFDDPRNGWPPNSPNTIKEKGSSRPLIDTGQMRKAIIYIIREKR